MTTHRILTSVAVLSLLGLLSGAQGAATTPPNPYIHKDVCPFECCMYRDWTTNKPITLVDKANGTTKIATVPAKTVVTGVTGDVYAVPIRIVATHAFTPDAPIKKGDVFYALHADGEGFWSVWFKGKVYSIDMTAPADDELLANATSTWWVKIKLKNGKTGWVLDTDQFDNQDTCG